MNEQKRRKPKYPGTDKAEQQRRLSSDRKEEEPDWVGNAPNYDKFSGWTPEEVLVYLNID